MKKNLASLGTALSRDEAKKVVGGNGPDDGIDDGACIERGYQCCTTSECCADLVCGGNDKVRACACP